MSLSYFYLIQNNLKSIFVNQVMQILFQIFKLRIFIKYMNEVRLNKNYFKIEFFINRIPNYV